MAKNKNKSSGKKASPALTFFLAVLCLVLGMVAGFYGNVLFTGETYEIPETQKPTHSSGGSVSSEYDAEVIKDKDLSVHFLELGNKYTGDCTLIKVGDTEVLIDAGSKTSSVATIKSYVDNFCADGVLEYVIVTHAHEDHYAGFATSATTDSIFDLYECETIITFSQITSGKENQKMYKNFLRELNDEVSAGATHLTADDCAGDKFDLGSGVEWEILDSKYYYEEPSTESNHSVGCMIN